MRDAVDTDAGLDVIHWRRHRGARLAVALVVAPLAFLAPDHRGVLVGAALVLYLPVALLIARLPRQPTALSPMWWIGVLADCAGLALVLALVPGAEPVAFAGFILVIVVQGTVFGLRAGMVAALAAAVAATGAHLVLSGGHLLLEHVIDLGAFMAVAGLVTHIVGRQTEELRLQRARLNEALEDLRRVDELRSRLVSTLAHDIRGPLGAIKGSLQSVLQRRAELDPAIQTELLQGAERQASRLVRLALGLLDLARLEEGHLELEIRQVRLAELLERALSYADPQGRIDIHIDPQLRMAVDSDRVEQIFVNLATNTLRHGSPPFDVVANVSDGWAQITFRDAGPGVPHDRIGSLFEPFRRGDTAGSVGLGLWIVRMLTEAHGGRATYEPNTPSGACFRVTLPSADGDGSGRLSPPDPLLASEPS